MQVLRSSEALVLKTDTRGNIPEDGNLHSHRSENLKSYTTLAGCTLQQRRNVFPLRYEDDFLQSHRSENLIPFIVLTGWAL
jgi:hypothetical protein